MICKHRSWLWWKMSRQREPPRSRSESESASFADPLNLLASVLISPWSVSLVSNHLERRSLLFRRTCRDLRAARLSISWRRSQTAVSWLLTRAFSRKLPTASWRWMYREPVLSLPLAHFFTLSHRWMFLLLDPASEGSRFLSAASRGREGRSYWDR